MSIIGLWLPILVSAAIVFVASAAVWMVLPWHKSDFSRTGDEAAVRGALKGSAPGVYMLPFCTDPKEMQKSDVKQKYIDGPLGYITIVPNGVPQMGTKLILSFVYYIVVGGICAYVVSRTLAPAASYLAVFRISGTVAFIAYGIAYVQDSIWFGRPWSLTAKGLVDALIYALLTGGVFGWLA